MSYRQSSAFSIGDLLRAGVSPYTREAAALAAEVCRQVFSAGSPLAPTADDVLLCPGGSLTINDAGSATVEGQMAALASLLETLLPPLGSEGPDYAVRSSLRMMAPRARAMPGLAPIPGPEGLAAELSEHATTDPIGVLRELWTRGDRALHQYLPLSRSDERLNAAAVRTRVEAPEPEPIASPPTANPRHRRPSLWRPVTAAALFTLGFAGGAWLGERSYQWTSRFAAKTNAHHSTMPFSGRTTSPRGSANSGAAGTEAAPSAHRADSSTTPAPLQISGVTGPAFSPSFTEDGHELMFHVGRDPVARIATARLGPGDRADFVAVLSDDRARTYHARRSPDGQFVAFDSDRDGELAVYVARRDWSAITRVSGAGMAALPTWSPNMKWLAMVRAEPKRPHVWNLWLRDVRSGAL